MNKMVYKLNQVKKFMGLSIFNKIVNEYPESTKLIIAGRYEKLRQRFPAVAKKIGSCKYGAGGREYNVFSMNVSLGWVLENFAMILINKMTGLKVIGDGADKERSFLPSKYVSSKADFTMINNKGETVMIEFTADYGGYASRDKILKFRNEKFPSLLKQSKECKVMLMNIDLKNNTFFLQDVTTMNYWVEKNVYDGNPGHFASLDFPVYSITKENMIEQFDKINN